MQLLYVIRTQLRRIVKRWWFWGVGQFEIRQSLQTIGCHAIISMPKRSSKKKSKDVNVSAAQIIAEAAGEAIPKPEDSTKNPAAVALGRLGGLKGGKARASKLTPEQSKEIAKKQHKPTRFYAQDYRGMIGNTMWDG